MKVQMKVFSVEPSTRQQVATLKDGTLVRATIQCIKAQLIPGDDDDHGTMTLSLTGPEADEAKGWTFGQTVTVNVE